MSLHILLIPHTNAPLKKNILHGSAWLEVVEMISFLSAVTGLPSPKSMSFLEQNSTSNHQRLSSQVAMETASDSAPFATPLRGITGESWRTTGSWNQEPLWCCEKSWRNHCHRPPEVSWASGPSEASNHHTDWPKSPNSSWSFKFRWGLPPRLIVSHCFAWNLYNFLTFWCFIPLILVLLANIWGLRTWLGRTGLSILAHRLCMEVWRATIHWRCAMCIHV